MIWKDVKDYEGLYKVSKNGDVMNSVTNRFLKQNFNYKGYKIVCLCKNGVKKTKTVHRLVARAFILGKENFQVNHIDGNKTNNNANNLEWVTASENILHARKLGLMNSKNSNKHLIKTIKAKNILTNEEISINGSSEMLRLGFNRRAVYLCLSGKRNKHHGYSFKR